MIAMKERSIIPPATEEATLSFSPKGTFDLSPKHRE
jgi:hypothetical protein